MIGNEIKIQISGLCSHFQRRIQTYAKVHSCDLVLNNGNMIENKNKSTHMYNLIGMIQTYAHVNTQMLD